MKIGRRIQEYLKGQESQKGLIDLEKFYGAVAKREGVDNQSDAEDALQDFLAYLKGVWYPKKVFSVANRPDDELEQWVTATFCLWLRDWREKKREKEVSAEPLGDCEEGTPPEIITFGSYEEHKAALKAKKAFLESFGPAGPEWAKREKRSEARWLLKIIQRGFKEAESAEKIFDRIVRVLVGRTLRFPSEDELTAAQFRSLLKLCPAFFTQKELAYIVGLTEDRLDYQVQKEKIWDKPSELQEEVELRSLVGRSSTGLEAGVGLLFDRLDDVIRKKAKMEPVEDRAERLWNALEDMKEAEPIPQNPKIPL